MGTIILSIIITLSTFVYLPSVAVHGCSSNGPSFLQESVTTAQLSPPPDVPEAPPSFVVLEVDEYKDIFYMHSISPDNDLETWEINHELNTSYLYRQVLYKISEYTHQSHLTLKQQLIEQNINNSDENWNKFYPDWVTCTAKTWTTYDSDIGIHKQYSFYVEDGLLFEITMWSNLSSLTHFQILTELQRCQYNRIRDYC